MAQPVTILLCCTAIIGLLVNQIEWNAENSELKLFVNSSNDSDAQGQLSIGALSTTKNYSAIRLITLISNEHTEAKNSNRSEINITDDSTNFQRSRMNSENRTDDVTNQQLTEQPQQQNITFDADDLFENYSPVDSQNKNQNSSTDNSTDSESGNRSSSSNYGSQNALQFQETTNESRNKTANASSQAVGGSNSLYDHEYGWQSDSAANNSADNVTILSRNGFSNEDQNEEDNSSSGRTGNSSSQLHVQCEGEVDNPTPITDVSRSQRLFALRLYKTIRAREPANLAVSTANTFFSLAEIFYGAVEQTRAELQFALQLPSPYCYDPLRGYEDSMNRLSAFNKEGVALAHGIFLSREYEVSSQFTKVVTSSFHSKVNRLTNRGSPAEWFAKNGNPFGMLLSRFVSAENIHGNESITLLNGAYIKGSWLNKFHRCTENIKIHGGSRYGVSESPSMQSVGKFNYGKLPEVDASFIEIPLADIDNSGHGAIFIILPNEAHGLDKLESKMNEATIGQKIFNGNSETVNVILPEFMIEYHSDLVGTLRQMNLNKMFNDEADFKNITVSGPAKVDLVLHKLVIHGRTTGDSTSCAWNVTASDTETIQFKADHPFLIVVAIRDENPIIISIARLAVANDNF